LDANRMSEGGVGTFRILSVSGSGRSGSFNTALLRAAQKLLPESTTLEIYDVSKFPLFNEDIENHPPPEVRAFKTKIVQADAILIATPEYNYSVPAVLKNALEWGNRPEGENSWDDKPAAIMSASTGPSGGRRAQLQLRQILVDLNMHPLNSPQVMVERAEQKFDENLALTDPATIDRLRRLVESLRRWAVRLGDG
jgi:chromate reductase, NAD(P)H dehydrogenase (quinone)